MKNLFSKIDGKKLASVAGVIIAAAGAAMTTLSQQAKDAEFKEMKETLQKLTEKE